MHATNGAPTRVRWQVCWQDKRGKIQRKDFEHDLAGALELYVKVVKAERKAATLRSCNMAFPPPDKYADWETDRFEIFELKRNGQWKKFKKPLPDALIIPRVYQGRMHAVNVRGIWWCPYCMKLRRFVKRNYFIIDGIKVPEVSMNCPVCSISNRDAAIQKYNPIAQRYQEMRRDRSDKGVRRS